MPEKSGSVSEQKSPPDHYEQIVNEITNQYEKLSERYKQVARYVTQNPNNVAMESVNSVAAKCGVHPSVLVRFAQVFGYSGFKQMQTVFQSRLATAAPGFDERVKALKTDIRKSREQGIVGFMHDLVVRDIATLQELLNSVTEENLQRAATLLKDANTIYIAGQLRSESIAIFLRYLLTMLKQRVVLLDPAGGLAPEMARTMGPDDVLLAIAFRHYAKETISIADIASQAGAPIVGITDSPLSPLAKDSTVLFSIPEDEYSFSRSLAAPMCLSQSIAIALASLLQPDEEAPRIATVTGNERRRARRPRETKS
ncbi:(Fe-S)-cluster assembly protein [Marinobacterium nitratireducens]|uniref:(Fe-S)-cluster assembly protein n=1 Tax=Marinobacterium nitratireducens TaxID=518897 RepID=A0A917ZKH5_9GAMM|nr:MurR/RpiR family transcriptional regulator [Marinobacterium nitratireducens]GGO84380.1 (Fe-S)-cluster assembly protein [Marinobacterium nitratireducens]